MKALNILTVVIMLLTAASTISSTYADHDTSIEEDIEAALIANFIDSTEAEKGAHAVALALQASGFTYNQASADMIISIQPDEDTDADSRYETYSVLVCISNNGFPVPSVGMKVWCATYTNDSDVNDKHIKVIKPDGTEIQIFDDKIDPPHAQAFPITMDQAGHWQVEVDYTQDGSIIIDLEVSWLVLPESAIGAVAIIGSSIAVFATYSLRKRNN